MQQSCYDPKARVDPMNRRKLYRDLRPNPFRPEDAVAEKFFAPENVKEIQKQAILLGDTKLLNSNITREAVLKEMQVAYRLYQSARALQHRNEFFHKHHSVDNPAAKIFGGATLLKKQDLTPAQIKTHLDTMKDQVLKTVKFMIFSRQKEEEKARQLGVGVHSQEGRIGRPHRYAQRARIARTQNRGLDAGSGYQAPGIQDLRAFY